MPKDPLESFLVLKLLEINSAENTTLDKVTKIGAPFPEKNSEYVPDMKHFQRAYCVRLFPGLNVFAFS